MAVFRVFVASLLMHSVAAQSQGVPESCLHVDGLIIDYATRKPLNDARVSIKLALNRMQISTSTASGAFSADLPCEATEIIVEKAGYRPQYLPLQSVISTSGKPSLPVVIPLIIADRQADNRAYLQTEQKAYIQQSSGSDSGKASGDAVQHGRFIVTDAIRDTPLRAELCFIPTKTGRRDCLNTTDEGQLTLDFVETDVVAIEVTSAGYQRYEGNLLVESVDGRTVTHPLKLQRELTILTLRADKATRCELLTATKSHALMPIADHPGWFCSYTALPGSYTVVATYAQGISRRAINLSGGLNYAALSEQKMNAGLTAATVSEPIRNAVGVASMPVSMDSLPMIYFEQSSYTLTTNSQNVLKQVVRYLTSNAGYSIQIAGHTDNVGDERLNKTLSEYRAAVVATFLIRQGVAERQCQKVGLGSQQPIVANDTEENKARNRRVSLKVFPTQ